MPVQESNLGPLTTIFTHPEYACGPSLSLFIISTKSCIPRYAKRCSYWVAGPNVGLPWDTSTDPQSYETKCFPESYLPTQGLFYSPGLECPHGWTKACTRHNVKTQLDSKWVETIHTCCPAFVTTAHFSCRETSSNPWDSTENCVWSISSTYLTSITIHQKPSSDILTTSSTVTNLVIGAFGIEIRSQYTDDPNNSQVLVSQLNLNSPDRPPIKATSSEPDPQASEPTSTTPAAPGKPPAAPTISSSATDRARGSSTPLSPSTADNNGGDSNDNTRNFHAGQNATTTSPLVVGNTVSDKRAPEATMGTDVAKTNVSDGDKWKRTTVGIGVASATGFFFILAALVYFILRRRKQSKESQRRNARLTTAYELASPESAVADYRTWQSHHVETQATNVEEDGDSGAEGELPCFCLGGRRRSKTNRNENRRLVKTHELGAKDEQLKGELPATVPPTRIQSTATTLMTLESPVQGKRLELPRPVCEVQG